MSARSAQRKQFLTDLLITAIEHAGYGFPEALVYEPDADQPHAVIIDRYESEGLRIGELEQYWVTLDTMAHGLEVLRKSTDNPADWVKELMLASRTNGDDGDYDVIGALAVLECALFGEVVYG